MAELSITLTVHNACSVGLCLCRKIDAFYTLDRMSSSSEGHEPISFGWTGTLELGMQPVRAGRLTLEDALKPVHL